MALCSSLQSINGYAVNFEILGNITNNNLTVGALEGCRNETCAAFFGVGNADITGVGVLVGYFLDFGLALLFAVLLLFLGVSKQRRLSRSYYSLAAVYADSAILLALSIELACAIMLIRKNFSLGAKEIEAFTVENIWIVATLVMLPTLSFCWHDLKDERFELRLTTITISFVLFLMIFISKMISTFSGGQTGDGAGSVASKPEWGQILDLCFEDNLSTTLSTTESNLVGGFMIGASLWISCNIVLAISTLSFSKFEQLWFGIFLRRCVRCLQDEVVGIIVAMLSLILWSVPLFWGLLTLQSKQKNFAASIGEEFGSETWSIGQIMAVVVFLPVLLEVWNQYLQRDRCLDDTRKQAIDFDQSTALISKPNIV